MFKNHQTPATHSQLDHFGKGTLLKRTLPMHSMDLNTITLCTVLESCLPLVLLLVGKFA